MKRLKKYGDSAFLIEWPAIISSETSLEIRALTDFISSNKPEGVLDIIPAYCSLGIRFLPERISQSEMETFLNSSLSQASAASVISPSLIEIPISYEDEFALDKELIEEECGMTWDEIMRMHQAEVYEVHMLGFSPGFIYLGELDERIQIPRLSSPRLQVPAGSIGIAGAQTGCYSLPTPGGWPIIGRTPKRLFNLESVSLELQVGDQVRFKSINKEEFLNLSQDD